MVEAYFRSVATLNLARAFIGGGYGEFSLAGDWKKHQFSQSPIMGEYDILLNKLERDIIKKYNDCNIDDLELDNKIYISHDGLILDYEEALTRIDTTTGKWYATSAHMLWVGDRTRQLENAHIEFLRGVTTIGIKIGPKHDLK